MEVLGGGGTSYLFSAVPDKIAPAQKKIPDVHDKWNLVQHQTRNRQQLY